MIKYQNMNTLMGFIFAIGLCACDKPETGYLQNRPAKYDQVALNGGTPKIEFAPKIEMLFVVDNSKSMARHIENLSNNIDQFAKAIAKSSILDIHIAVVTVYDERRFTSQKYQEMFSGQQQFERGQFRPVVGADGQLVPGKSFISNRDENFADLLRHTLKVGVQDLDQGGPEVEELFAPVAAVYGIPSAMDSIPTAKNDSLFFMKDSYKVIVFISDAPDASTISGSDVYRGLKERSANNAKKVLGFGAIVPFASKDCSRDPGGAERFLEDFLSQATSGGAITNNVMSLCSANFGQQLAAFGEAIRKNTLSEEIRLPVEPYFPSIQVTYGDGGDGDQQILPELDATTIGWSYEPESNSVHINPNFPFKYKPGATLSVTYEALNPTR